MSHLTWLYQAQPRPSWIARVAGGRFEIDLAACAYAFIADDEVGHAVHWRHARTLKEAQARCEAMHRNADDESSGRTVAVWPGLQASWMGG
jgi:hypothetical protein